MVIWFLLKRKKFISPQNSLPTPSTKTHGLVDKNWLNSDFTQKVVSSVLVVIGENNIVTNYHFLKLRIQMSRRNFVACLHAVITSDRSFRSLYWSRYSIIANFSSCHDLHILFPIINTQILWYVFLHFSYITTIFCIVFIPWLFKGRFVDIISRFERSFWWINIHIFLTLYKPYDCFINKSLHQAVTIQRTIYGSAFFSWQLSLSS